MVMGSTSLWWTLLLHLSTGYVNAKMPDISVGLSPRESLAKCISYAAETYFDHSDIITYSMSLTGHSKYPKPLDEYVFEELYKKGKWSLLVTNPETIHNATNTLYKKSDNFIIQVKGVKKIRKDLESLQRFASWNPYARFVIISNVGTAARELVTTIVEILWGENIVNGIFILPSGSGISDPKYEIYGWFPFDDGNCADNFLNVQVLDECTCGFANGTSNWFPPKIPTTLSKCPVQVGATHYPPFIIEPDDGLEYKLLELIAEISGIQFVYEFSKNHFDSGSVYRNTGMMGELANGQLDIVVGSLSVSTNRNSKLDPSSVYTYDSIKFCVPHAETLNQWGKLVNVLSPHIGAALITLMLLILTLSYFHSNLNSEYEAYRNIFSILQKVVAILLGNAINLQPRTNNVRIVIMMWIIFSQILSTTYQSYLTSALTNVIFKPQISTLEEVLKTNLNLLFLPSQRKYFKNTTYNDLTDRLLRRWQNCNDLIKCLNRTAWQRDSAITASQLYAEYALLDYKNEQGNDLLYCFRQSVIHLPIVMYMRKNFPLYYRINELIIRIVSAGFLSFWGQNIFRRNDLFKYGRKSENHIMALGMQHLYPLFLVLLGGLALSVLIFSVEMCWFHYTNRRSSRLKFIH